MSHFCFLLFALLGTLPTLFSEEIELYFKKVKNRSAGHSMKNIDFIYMINLDERPEKFAACKKKLGLYGIVPFRFSAVNGWKLPTHVINAVGVRFKLGEHQVLMGTTYDQENGHAHEELMQVTGRTYFCQGMGRGSIGIVLSHLSVLQDAYDEGYKTIWVMEDDIEVIQNPTKLSRLIEKLDIFVGEENWDILFTDKDTKGQDGNYVICTSYCPRPNFIPSSPSQFEVRKIVSPSFRKISARYGAYSMIIRRSGMKKILDFMKKYKLFAPYDMEFYLPEEIQLYTVLQDVVSTEPQALSDNRFPGYQRDQSGEFDF